MGDEWPAGWYDDPSGVPGQQRWWNGASWTAHVRRQEAGGPDAAAAAPTQALWPAPDRPTEVLEHGPSRGDRGDPWTPYAPEAERAPSSPLPWILGIGGGALLVLVLAIVGIVLLRDDEPAQRSGTSFSGPSPGTTPEPGPTTGGPSSPAPSDPRRVTDAASGLSFARLPDWDDWTGGAQFVGIGTAGQYVVTQQTAPGGGQYVAQVFLGLVDRQVPYAGPDSLQDVTEAVATAVEQTPGAYPPHAVRQVSSQRITVDGRPGWRVRMDLTFTDAEGFTATGERLDVALIDLGDRRLGGVIASIPNDHNDLLPDVDKAYRTLHISKGGAGGAATASPTGPSAGPTA